MALILFDFDGVLADTLGDMIQFAQETCNELKVSHVVTPEDLDALDTMSLLEYGRQLEVPGHLLDEFVSRTLKKQFIEKQTPPDIFSGMDKVVKNLSINHVIGIVTGNTAANVNLFLAEHGLDDCVRTIFGVDSPGSKAEKISWARSQFGAEGEAVFMVGDSVSDVRSAGEAGVKSIAVSWGHQSLEKISAAGPDYLIHSPNDLLEIIAKTVHQQ